MRAVHLAPGRVVFKEIQLRDGCDASNLCEHTRRECAPHAAICMLRACAICQHQDAAGCNVTLQFVCITIIDEPQVRRSHDFVTAQVGG